MRRNNTAPNYRLSFCAGRIKLPDESFFLQFLDYRVVDEAVEIQLCALG
jgi:hypothetical protein